jgi:hypothetical protein
MTPDTTRNEFLPNQSRPQETGRRGYKTPNMGEVDSPGFRYAASKKQFNPRALWRFA